MKAMGQMSLDQMGEARCGNVVIGNQASSIELFSVKKKLESNQLILIIRKRGRRGKKERGDEKSMRQQWDSQGFYCFF